LENQTLAIPQPKPSVAEWPLIGESVYDAWNAAASNLPDYLADHKEQLTNLSKRLLSAAASTAAGVLQFLGALIIAGIMMAYGEAGSRAMLRIANRLAGQVEGPRIFGLSSATIRSVATGVIGVAFIQALLLGIGFIMAGVPGAGILALVVLLIGIMQLPALIISLPVIAYLWMAGDASTTINVVITVYLLIAGSADNVLKPLLLGRGVDVPMPIVLIGALGGMVSAGIIGLFVGAVLLSVGYQVFMGWVDNADDTTAAPDDPAAEAPPTV
ncbi:MAG: AI-2E family transporter, partial [Chromatiaceae bacterium]